MGPVRQPGSAAPSRTAPGSWLVALGVAVLGALGLALLPSCSSPTSPSRPFFVNPQIIDETDCTGVPVTSDPCDTSPPPTWNFPDLPCPTRAEVEEINREIPVKVNSDVSAGVLACRARDGSVDLTVVQNNIYQSLLFLRRVRIDMPLPWTSKPAYDWLRDTIPLGIVIESSGNSYSCLRCQGPIHIAYSSYDWLRPTVAYLAYALFVHEARHAENKPHTCALTQEYGYIRDKSVSEMGAFGVQYLLMMWLANYSDQPADFQEYARKTAARQLAGGSFCCECGGMKKAQRVSLMTQLFRQPAQVAQRCRRISAGAVQP